MSEPRLRSLLRQAQSVARANKRAAARQLYEDILTEYPNAVAAWLGLAPLLDDEEGRRQALEQVLALDPGNETAQAALAQLDGNGLAFNETTADGDLSHRADLVDDDPFAAARRYLDEATASPGSKREPDGTLELPAEPSDPPVTPAPLRLDQEAVLVCANHPNRETTLRCNRCGKPVCTDCIKRTPVGYRCKQCVREQEDAFFTAGPWQYVIALAVALPLSFLGPFLLNLIGGFWFLALFISPALGTGIGRLVFYAIGRRRGRYISYLVGASMILGVLAVWILGGSLLTLGIYAFLAVSAAFYQLR
jgi:hypothetical protein